MSLKTEGYISKITLDGSRSEIHISIEPTPPYLVGDADDSEKRSILLRGDGMTAKIVPASCVFARQVPSSNCDFDVNSLLIMKVNRLKVGFTVCEECITEKRASVIGLRVL